MAVSTFLEFGGGKDYEEASIHGPYTLSRDVFGFSDSEK
jgi:hypothetical protein